MKNTFDENTRVKNSNDIMQSGMYNIEIIRTDGSIIKVTCIFRIEYFMYNGEKWCIKEFTSIDDGSKVVKKQLHECTFEEDLILNDPRAKVYYCHLDKELQKQIKLYNPKKALESKMINKKLLDNDAINEILSFLC